VWFCGNLDAKEYAAWLISFKLELGLIFLFGNKSGSQRTGTM